MMLIEMEIGHLFNYICGMDKDDKLDKAALINRCLKLCGCSNSEAVLIGDSINDLDGANKASTHFIGVTYGFGFPPDQSNEGIITANNPGEIANILLT